MPSADDRAVWVVSRRVATRVPLAGGARLRVPLPPHARLVADTPSGLIVSTGTVPDPPLAPGRVGTPTPTPSATTPAPTGTVPATAGGTPTTTRSSTPAPTPAAPTTPPYTTASPVPVHRSGRRCR